MISIIGQKHLRKGGTVVTGRFRSSLSIWIIFIQKKNVN